MKGWLGRRWAAACAATIGHDAFWTIAVDHWAIRRALAPMIERYVRGVTLDAGAGKLAWRDVLEPHVEWYLPFDFARSHPDLMAQCDIQGHIPLRTGCIDTIFCCSVLEHVSAPWEVLPEFARLLAPGGRIILSVPFLYHLHGAPEDYFRFTPFGVRRLAESADLGVNPLEVVEMSSSGGLAHAIAQILSILTTATIWEPGSSNVLISSITRSLAFLARSIDSFDRDHLSAQSINVVLKRKD